MNAQRHYVWYGHACSEGGPVLVADLDDYPAWSGADAAWTDDASYRVHFYGPFIKRLPASFQPDGEDAWHQYAVVKGLEASRDYVRQLRAAAEAVEPGLTMCEQRKMDIAALMTKAAAAIEKGPSSAGEASSAMQDWLASWRDHIEGGFDFHAGEERALHVDAAPDTDYARACEALEEDVAIVSFGSGGAASGVVWDLEGAGIADVALADDGFLLARSWLDSDGKYLHDARKCAVTSEDEEPSGQITFATGRLAVVWAPVLPKDLVASGEPGQALRAAAELLPPVQLNQRGILNVGTLIRVAPGSYQITCGMHEEEEWQVRWMRCTALALRP